MNITEANAVNSVLALTFAKPTRGYGIALDRAEEAAALLADHAHKALSAGLDGVNVHALWRDVASRRAALIGFLDTFGSAHDLLADLGPTLTCTESDALVTLLSMHGQSTAAAVLFNAHADGDDEGDAHYRAGCEGHESLDGAHMGESVYCDGSCQRPGGVIEVPAGQGETVGAALVADAERTERDEGQQRSRHALPGTWKRGD